MGAEPDKRHRVVHGDRILPIAPLPRNDISGKF